MSLQSWPLEERPREKLLALGANSLSNAELLAILLRSGNKKQDVVTLARSLLTHCGGLQGVFQASHRLLSQCPGIGFAKYAQLQAALALTRRYLLEPIRRETLPTNSNAIRNYLAAELRNHEQEVFACLFLDAHHKLIRFEKLFIGTFNMAVVFPREVTKKALDQNAAAIIAAHNHPSGNPTPSHADQRLTKHLIQALDLFGIKLLDHVIIAGNQSLSFQEHGLL